MMPNKDKWIFGITGPTGSGKSQVAGLFSPYDAYILDIDQVGHDVLATTAYPQVVAAFGASILNEDQTVNRKKLGTIVFSDAAELETLNRIMHSHIQKRVFSLVSQALLSHDIIVLDGALLFDMKLHLICTHTILVLANEKYRLARIINRDQLDKTQAQNRINSQRDYTQLLALVDIVIENTM